MLIHLLSIFVMVNHQLSWVCSDSQLFRDDLTLEIVPLNTCFLVLEKFLEPQHENCIPEKDCPDSCHDLMGSTKAINQTECVVEPFEERCEFVPDIKCLETCMSEECHAASVEECQEVPCSQEKSEKCEEKIIEECITVPRENCRGDLVEEMGIIECSVSEQEVCDCPKLTKKCEIVIKNRCDPDPASEESQLLECIGPSCALCQSSQNCVRINETKFEVALTRKCKNVPFENCECPEICQVLPKNICKKFPVKKKDHVCEEKPVRQCRKVKETICDGFVPIQGPGNPIPVEQELFKDHSPRCQDVYKEVCHPVLTTICKDVVHEVLEKVCTSENKTLCRTEPCQCHQAPRKVCQDVPVQVSNVYEVQKCDPNPCTRQPVSPKPSCLQEPVTECTTIHDPTLECPTKTDCRLILVETCRMKQPGCLETKCRRYPQLHCQFLPHQVCPKQPQKCISKPVRQCQKVPCKCSQVFKRECHKVLKDHCRHPGRVKPCSKPCSTRFVCPMCKSLEKPHFKDGL